MHRLYIFILAICSVAFGQEPPLRLTFGVYQSDRATVMYRKFTPVIESLRVQLENQLNREVDIRLTIFDDYESGIQTLAAGEVDFVRFGSSSFILATEKNENIQLLAMELLKGLKRFNGLIIARKDSGIQSIKDINGKSFAFGDEYSTIGRYLSQSQLVNHGIVETDLKNHSYLGRHDLVAQAVINGQFDAGALKASTYKKLCDSDEIIIVKAFENVTKPWIAREGLPPKICNAIIASLISLEDEIVLEELGCSGFTNATMKDFDLVIDGMENAKQFFPKDEE